MTSVDAVPVTLEDAMGDSSPAAAAAGVGVSNPILSDTPPPLGAFPTDHADVASHLARMEATAPNAALANVAGLPALTIPLPTSGATPTAVQLIGPKGSDAMLLALAATITPPAISYPAAIAGMPA